MSDRLISAEKLAEILGEQWCDECMTDDCYYCNIYKIKEIVRSMPTVDAELVIRCKDCKYLEPSLNSDWSLCCYFDSKVRGDDFCSHGERREDE